MEITSLIWIIYVCCAYLTSIPWAALVRVPRGVRQSVAIHKITVKRWGCIRCQLRHCCCSLFGVRWSRWKCGRRQVDWLHWTKLGILISYFIHLYINSNIFNDYLFKLLLLNIANVKQNKLKNVNNQLLIVSVV